MTVTFTSSLATWTMAPEAPALPTGVRDEQLKKQMQEWVPMASLIQEDTFSYKTVIMYNLAFSQNSVACPQVLAHLFSFLRHFCLKVET